MNANQNVLRWIQDATERLRVAHDNTYQNDVVGAKINLEKAIAAIQAAQRALFFAAAPGPGGR